MFRKACLLAATAIVASTGAARADIINITFVDGDAILTATMVCEFNAQTNTFTFTLNNTTPLVSPQITFSSITAIGFDLPPLGNASNSGLNGFTGQQAPSLTSFFTFSDAPVGNVPGDRFAELDFAFLTGRNFAAGRPTDGIEGNESASFTVSGAAFAGFTEEQICNSVHLRFQGYNN